MQSSNVQSSRHKANSAYTYSHNDSCSSSKNATTDMAAHIIRTLLATPITPIALAPCAQYSLDIHFDCLTCLQGSCTCLPLTSAKLGANLAAASKASSASGSWFNPKKDAPCCISSATSGLGCLANTAHIAAPADSVSSASARQPASPGRHSSPPTSPAGSAMVVVMDVWGGG